MRRALARRASKKAASAPEGDWSEGPESLIDQPFAGPSGAEAKCEVCSEDLSPVEGLTHVAPSNMPIDENMPNAGDKVDEERLRDAVEEALLASG